MPKTKTKLLLRDQILAANDLKTERVEVPEWGGAVTVRSMTAGDRDQWEQRLWGGKRDVALTQVRASLVAFTVVDDAGELMFSVDDLEALSRKSSAALTRIYETAVRLNKIAVPE